MGVNHAHSGNEHRRKRVWKFESEPRIRLRKFRGRNSFRLKQIFCCSDSWESNEPPPQLIVHFESISVGNEIIAFYPCIFHDWKTCYLCTVPSRAWPSTLWQRIQIKICFGSMPSLMMLKAILKKAKFRFPPKTSTLSENLLYREKTKLLCHRYCFVHSPFRSLWSYALPTLRQKATWFRCTEITPDAFRPFGTHQWCDGCQWSNEHHDVTVIDRRAGSDSPAFASVVPLSSPVSRFLICPYLHYLSLYREGVWNI